MSLLLRHRPEVGGLTLDAEGYVSAVDLLRVLNADGHDIDRAGLNELVATNEKKRFAFDETGTLIRAVQGHSKEVNLKLEPVTPPDVLFHGTVAKFLEPILDEGLVPKGRQHVHLSGDWDTATAVGSRRGKPIVLKVDTAGMHAEGHAFYQAENGVWLTDRVPPQYISR